MSHPLSRLVDVQSSSLRFARTVQTLGAAARAMGLEVPGFRSPPRLVGVQRSIKRWPGGSTVAVVVRGRPWAAVQADLVEGVVAANHLTSPAADRARAELWAALEPAGAAPPSPPVAVEAA
jgi:hypothetical protein